MNLKQISILFFLLVVTFVAPTFAQINWSNRSPSGISDAIWGSTYANGTFAAVTDQGKVLTSTDGITWSSQTVDQGVWLVSITYGNGTWVVVGAGGAILVSTDLKTWVSAKAVTTNKLNGVLYAIVGSNGTVKSPSSLVGLFVAVGDNATVITSPDALNWTVQTVPAGITGFLHGITTGPNLNVVIGGTPTVFFIGGAQSGNGTGPVNTGVILEMGSTPTTSGGQTFSIFAYDNGTPGNLEAVNGLGTSIVAAGWGTIISGAGFQPSAVPNVVYRGLIYGNGYYVAAGEQGTILTSSNGSTWTQRFSGDSPSDLSTSTLLSAAYSETLQRFIVTGTSGTVLVSNSVPTVFANVSTRGYVSSTQTFIGGFVVEGTAPRTVLIRADGPVLSTFSVPSPLPDPVLTVYDNKGNVVATNTGWSTSTNPTTISTAALEVGAFALPNPSLDSALLLTLPPGAYTAQITSAKGNSGIALFEAYTN